MQMDYIGNHATYCTNLLRDFAQLLFLPIKHYFHRHKQQREEDGDGDGELPELSTPTTMNESGDRQAVVRDDDIEVVIRRLGMPATRGGGGGGGESINELLEEKTASLEELKEAFGVFDKNDDGFITAGELWCVMRGLGFREGMRLEDCRLMIRAFDEDGDGRIDFQEFTLLMENSP